MTRAAKADRERDILDALALQQITRREAEKLLEDLTGDYYEALMTLNLQGACDETQ